MTLLPAVLSLLGDRVDALRVPFIGRRPVDEGRGFWASVARAVMRRPGISLAAAVAVLVAAAIPLTSITSGFAGISTLPDSFASKQGFAVLDEELGFGETAPAYIVVDGDVRAEPVSAAIGRLTERLSNDDAFGPPNELVRNEAGDLGVLMVPMAGDASSEEATQAIETLRDVYVPGAFAGVDAEVLVGGETAENVDFFDMTNAYLPIVIAFVLGLSLPPADRRVPLAGRAGQVDRHEPAVRRCRVRSARARLPEGDRRRAAGLPAGRSDRGLAAAVPLQRALRALDGLPRLPAVAGSGSATTRPATTRSRSSSGSRSTGRIITGAALIMVAVFGGFAAGELVMFQQMGFGLGVAVLLDATIVRCVLVPATMRLLGDRNWYLPRRLEWLPDLRVEAAEPSR